MRLLAASLSLCLAVICGLRVAPAAAGTEPGEALPMPVWDLWRDCVSIVQSYAGPPGDMRAAIDLIAEGRVDVGSLVTHRLGLAETGMGFGLMVDARDSLKVVIEPQR